MLVFSPKLLNLLTDSEFLVSQWQPLLEIQFNAPKLNNDFNSLQLSIGTILSVACFLTRALSMVTQIILFTTWPCLIFLYFSNHSHSTRNHWMTSVKLILKKRVIGYNLAHYQQREQLIVLCSTNLRHWLCQHQPHFHQKSYRIWMRKFASLP